MVNPGARDRKGVLKAEEVLEMFRKAEERDKEYYRLRDRALVALFWLTGKRNLEVASLEMDDVKVISRSGRQFLTVSFKVLKKRRKAGEERRTKTLSLDSRAGKYILEYLEWMRKNAPKTRYLFPSTFYSPLTGKIEFRRNRHISTRQVERIIKSLNPKAWPHLFRDTRGARIIRRDPSIIGAFRVMRALDLENVSTALRYLTKYAEEVIEEDDLEPPEEDLYEEGLP